jgi:ligand-binding sensor domain-containing protein
VKKRLNLHGLMLLGYWTCLAPVAAFALDPAKTLFQYNCQSWTHQDGLPVNRVTSIAQAPEGYLWLGSQKGLVRFDGISFKSVTLPARPEFPSQAVSCLSSCREGGIWFGVTGGSFGLCDERGFVSFERQEWMKPGMNVLLETKECVWIGMDTGAARMSKGNGHARRDVVDRLMARSVR